MGKSRGVGFNTGSSTIVFLIFFFFFFFSCIFFFSMCFSGSIIEHYWAGVSGI